MKDPHVVSLTYQIKAGAGAMFNETSCQRGSTDQFDVDVRNGSAVFSFKMHFASESEARQATEPFIHAWQVQDGLEHSRANCASSIRAQTSSTAHHHPTLLAPPTLMYLLRRWRQAR
jgi:hypothetical protein